MDKEATSFWAGVAFTAIGGYLANSKEARAYLGKMTLGLLKAIDKQRMEIAEASDKPKKTRKKVSSKQRDSSEKQ